MLVLGGGGYTVRNVARCWTHETSVLTNTDLSNTLPNNEYIEYFGPHYDLMPELPSRHDNGNNREYLDTLVTQVHDMLRLTAHAPSVQMFDVDQNKEDDDKDPKFSEAAFPDDVIV